MNFHHDYKDDFSSQFKLFFRKKCESHNDDFDDSNITSDDNSFGKDRTVSSTKNDESDR